MSHTFSDIYLKPIGERTLPLLYLQRRKKPDHYTWETWYAFVNKQYLGQQKDYLESDAYKKQQQSEEESQLLREITNVFTPETFDPNITPGTNAAFSAGLGGISDVKLEDATTSSMVGETNDKVVNQLQVAKKTLELSEDLQKTIFEIVDLYLDPEVIFAMRKLKEIGKAMKGAPQAAGIVNEVTRLNQLKQENDEIKNGQSQQMQQPQQSFQPLNVKKELTYEQDQQQRQRSLFPSAKKQNFEQFSDVMKAGKRKPAASPGRGGPLSSPKSAKRNAPPPNLKSMAAMKMDIIAAGFDVLKKKKTVKVTSAIWTEVESLGRCVKQPQDTSFYPLMSNLFQEYEKLQETARGAQLKADLFDFIGSNVDYSRVSFQNVFFSCHVLFEFFFKNA